MMQTRKNRPEICRLSDVQPAATSSRTTNTSTEYSAYSIDITLIPSDISVMIRSGRAEVENSRSTALATRSRV